MLRTLLVGILAVSAAAACSSKSDPPAAQPGVAAGKVVEVSGKATATRGGEVRTLAQGSEISADDVIDTAADGRVVILVAHNNARWDLGPNKHGKVGESLAWTAAKVDRPADVVTEETSTAGRYAEKAAATTDTTTDKKQDSEPDMLPKGSDPMPPAAAVATGESGDEAAAPPPPPPPPPLPPREQNVKPSTTTESAKQSSPRRESEQSMGIGVGGPAGGGKDSPVSEIVRPADAIESTPEHTLRLEIQRTLVKQRIALAACLEGTERLVVLVSVTKGVYSFSTTDAAATDKTRACLGKVAKTLTANTKLDALVRVRTIIAR